MPRRTRPIRFRPAIFILIAILFAAVATAFFSKQTEVSAPAFSSLPVFSGSDGQENEFIKWVDFNASFPALEKALALDIQTYESEVHIKWTDVLAYLSCQYGNNFNRYQPRDIDELAEKLADGQTIESLSENMKNFPYYQECYEAILGGFLGEYQVEVPETTGGQTAENPSGSSRQTANGQTASERRTDERAAEGQIPSGQSADGPTEKGEKTWVRRYGLKTFSPIAEGFWYEDYSDFGVNRSYGYHRRHLGHDLMLPTGTPVVAIESGIVENMGWNQYGGWRLGIRSFDGKRYYYYAHMRKDRPYAAGLYQGKTISAGDVIGYTGRSGYSRKENVNNIKTPHLHVGMQLIFDESQREGAKEIWIDLYDLCKLLSKNRSAVIKDQQTKEYTRMYGFSEPNYFLRDSTVYVSAPAAPEGSIPVPIVMYHSLLKDPDSQNDFVVSPGVFESDLRYLKEHGYTAITMTELIAHVKQGGPLPEKPVLLTFDDGYYNNYFYAFPLLKEYDMKAVISIIGILTDNASELEENNPSYSYLTWNQIQELSASGYVEIQNHSMDLHHSRNNRHGAAKTAGEDLSAYTHVLDSDVNLMQHKIAKATGQLPNTFTYPFGEISKESDPIMRDFGFQATLGCRSGVNYILADAKAPDQLFNLRRNRRPPHMSSQEFFRHICP